MALDGIPTSTLAKWNFPILVFFKDSRVALKLDTLGREILSIAIPVTMALAADPVASLIDTMYIGHIGPLEIAAVGISIALFNQVSKVAIFPLVSITTSFVAEEETIEKINVKAMEVEDMKIGYVNKDSMGGETVEIVQVENPKNGLTEKGEKKEPATLDDSKTTSCTHEASIDRVANAPNVKITKRKIPSASTALLFGLALGVLETLFLALLAKPLLNLTGVKSDSPMLKPAHKYLTLRALGAPAVLVSLAMQGVFRGFKDTKTPLYATGDVANVILDPILIFTCKLGVSGAAIAHVLSHRFLKSGSLLLFRVVAATIPVTLAASLATRLGATTMAAFQICLQVWLTSSLLSDGLAVAGQAIIASSFAEKNYEKATAAATRVLQMGFVMGLGVTLLIGLGLQFGSSVFTKDINVKHIITIGIPILVSLASIGSLFGLYKVAGFIGIWVALSIFMGLRAIAGVWRMGTGTGPWSFLRK
ncbi:hypothetical protein L1987_01012 [Smallanthus sonchifolius]|uniref:Uncharacterized protein n=1 Tax=Smallanthus sonchifolius TaxID=185202 RepID=A0ACB9K3X6_9ASTR|nr:hypothetical protein L1987_01012 [Smallanthus sonchifolius]